MYRIALCAALAAGCGTSADDRPATFEFVTLAILQPACGTVACHSTTSNIRGYAFDTLAASRKALRQLVVVGNPSRSRLIDVITRKRMPPDSPMDDQDVALLEMWISDGAPGL